MEVAERETRVRRFVDEVWNGRDYEAATDLYSENYVNMFGTGPSARVEPIRRYHQAFPDLHLEVEELIVAGETAVLRVRFLGTDTGDTSEGLRRGGRWTNGRSPSCTSRTTR